MKKIIFLLFFVFGLSLSAHAETVRISGLFNSPTGTTSYNDGQSYCMNSNFGSNRTPAGYVSIGSDKSTIVCSFVELGNGMTFTMGIKHYCLKGGQADTAQFGCYGEKQPDACEGKPYTVGNKTNFLMSEKSTATRYLCVDGCKYSPSESWCIGGEPPCFFYGPFWRPTNGSLGECNFGEGGGSGEEEDPKNPEDGTQEEMQPTNCPAGTCPGTVNGNAVCLACNSNPVDDGGHTDDPNNPNSGSGGGEGGGTGSGGEGGGSGTGGTGTGTGGGGNGDDNGGSDWGGDCKKGFICEGDALVCAISRAEHDRNCNIIDDARDSDETDLYDQTREMIENSGEPRSGSAREGLQNTEVEVDKLMNSTSLFGEGSAPKNETFTFYGTKQEIPVDMLADVLRWIGIILKMMAFFIAIQIAFG